MSAQYMHAITALCVWLKKQAMSARATAAGDSAGDVSIFAAVDAASAGKCDPTNDDEDG